MDSLEDVIAALAAADFKGAGKVAREQLVPRFGAGFFPVEFRGMGLGMHRAADFTEVVRARHYRRLDPGPPFGEVGDDDRCDRRWHQRLATAFYIEQLRRDSRIVLYEESDDVGGTMRTENVDGFLFESGGNGFLTNKPDTLELVKDCGAESLLLPSSDAARIRYIFTNRLHRLPETPVAFLRSELLGFSDKLRVAAEVFVPPRAATGDETLQSFGYRRVGRAFTDTFLDAMCAGIHASTPERLSVNAAFPLVVQLEQQYGGLFKGMLKKRKRQAGPGGTLMSFRGGMSAFIRHLRSRLHAEVRTGTPVNEVQRAGQRYRLVTDAGTESFDQVVLATPA